MRDNFIAGILVVFFACCLVGLIVISLGKQEDRCTSNNGNHIFLVYYTSIPDTIRLSGSYRLTSYRGTNEIYQMECNGLSLKAVLSTTAPIKHIYE